MSSAARSVESPFGVDDITDTPGGRVSMYGRPPGGTVELRYPQPNHQQIQRVRQADITARQRIGDPAMHLRRCTLEIHAGGLSAGNVAS